MNALVVPAPLARDLPPPAMRARFTELGADVVANTPEQFATFLHNEIVQNSKLMKLSGAKTE